ncbi:MAG: phosphoglucosamine mutase [Bacteroidales bacterium]
MSLLVSISGIRGTIGGIPGKALTPVDIIGYTHAYAHLIKEQNPTLSSPKVVVGRDARISGPMVEQLVSATLVASGIDVIMAGLSSTPTVEMAILIEKAQGGIVITASHNPKEWNALKLLNSFGEFLNHSEGKRLSHLHNEHPKSFSSIHSLGKISYREFDQKHIDAILSHPLVEIEAIYRAQFTVVVDGINSVGGIVVPKLLEQLGVEVIKLNCEANGDFAHNPEPLPHHLEELSSLVKSSGASLGFAVDPDVDRLAIIDENGAPFGEEFTLVAVADYILSHKKGATVSNLSSSQALKDISIERGVEHFASAVGEVNVVKEMKRVGAVIGGEGNGGVIIPELHYGRDALIAIALFLSHLARSNTTVSKLRESYPNYEMVKKRVEITPNIDLQKITDSLKKSFAGQEIVDIDGIKIIFSQERSWVHIRGSNTEPILRIYSEAPTAEEAQLLAQKVIEIITAL